MLRGLVERCDPTLDCRCGCDRHQAARREELGRKSTKTGLTTELRVIRSQSSLT
jgi:hypothetical protein